MGFFEFAIAFSLTVGLPVAITKMVLDYRRARLDSERPYSDPENAIRVSELKVMMREVVQEEVAELRDRVEWIEDKLEIDGSHRLQEPGPQSALPPHGVEPRT